MQENTMQANASTNEDQNNIITAKVPEKEVEIYNGNDRPIAVMIDNHNRSMAASRTKPNIYSI